MGITINLIRVGLAGFIFASATPSFSADKPLPVQDLDYGQVLYDFYQQDYFPALVKLYAALDKDGIKGHGKEPQLLRGGIQLSYGMHAHAEKNFTQLLDEQVKPEVRDRAWFYLGKILYQRGYHEQSLSALAKAGKKLPDDFQQERLNYLGNLYLKQGEFEKAKLVLTSMSRSSEWTPYGSFNLGVTYSRAGNVGDAIDAFDRAVKLSRKQYSEESLSLQDHTHIAAAFTHLANGDNLLAIDRFQLVRLQGPYSSTALLGYGWAAANHGDFELALSPWNELASRALIDPNAQEALLAIGSAYEKLKIQGEALSAYRRAVDAYKSSLKEMDQIVANLQAGQLTNQLLDRPEPTQLGWFWNTKNIPNTQETQYLSYLIAQSNFQEALKQLRDLQFLKANLDEREQSIDSYSAMVDTRQEAYKERVPKIIEKINQNELSELIITRDKLAEKIRFIRASENSLALAKGEELAHFERLQRISQTLNDLPENRRKSFAARYAFLQGILEWDLTEEFVPRLWSLQKSMNQVDAAIAQSKQRYLQLNESVKRAPIDFSGARSKVDLKKSEIQQLQSRLLETQRRAETQISQLAVNEIQNQQSRIRTYLEHAQLAIARIYDEINQRDGKP